MKRILAFLGIGALAIAALTGCASGKADEAATDEVSESEASFEWIGPPREMEGIDEELIGEGGIGSVLTFTIQDRVKADKVAVFVHPWLPLRPWAYEKEIRDLAEGGSTVVFPIYQAVDSAVTELTGNLADALALAQRELDLDWDRAALIGQTSGAAVAFNVAAEARRRGLVPPAAVVGIDPGRNPEGEIPRSKLADIDPASRLLTGTRLGTRIPGARQEARRLLRRAIRVSGSQKEFFDEADQASGAKVGSLWRHVLRVVNDL